MFVGSICVDFRFQSNATRTRLKKRQYEETNNVQKVCL